MLLHGNWENCGLHYCCFVIFNSNTQSDFTCFIIDVGLFTLHLRVVLQPRIKFCKFLFKNYFFEKLFICIHNDINSIELNIKKIYSSKFTNFIKYMIVIVIHEITYFRYKSPHPFRGELQIFNFDSFVNIFQLRNKICFL